ncbi:MAG: pyridoxal phosphate-dependent aminotransferase [Eubacteriaceae bacterium]|jgi:aspartate aminotransferase|nr:pyridoxal phosphate-dependent aminotransferase [Eubacteriaceae bacterium]
MKKPLSAVLDKIQPSITMGITSKAQALREQGHTVYSLGAGEPDFPVHSAAKMAAVEAIAANKSKYGSVEGIWELRAAIAEKLRAENAVDASPSEVIVTSGAKQGLFCAMQALCSPGEEILIPTPAWVSYVEMARIAGAVPVAFPTSKENGFKITPGELESALTENTKAVIVNSPSNPTGAVYTREELYALYEVCERAGVYAISDEIYEKFLYDGAKHVSMASLGDKAKETVVTVNGFSKAFSMPGWRVGYVMAEQPIIRAMSAIQGHCVSHASLIGQYAAAAALSLGSGYFSELASEYAQRRAIAKAFLDEYGIGYPDPLGAFYIFCDISPYLTDEAATAAAWCEKLLEEEKVVCVPGEFFGSQGCIRISYAAKKEVLSEALGRIGSFLERRGAVRTPGAR